MASKYRGEREREAVKFLHGTALGYSFDPKDEAAAQEIAMAAIDGDVDILNSVPAKLVMNVKSALKSEGFAELAKRVQSSDPLREMVREIIITNTLNEGWQDIVSSIKSGVGQAYDYVKDTTLGKNLGIGGDDTNVLSKILDDLHHDTEIESSHDQSDFDERMQKLAGIKSDDKMQKFYDIADAANNVGAKFPELAAAQWALESGWGEHMSGLNNPFGQKAGAGENSTAMSTKEFSDGAFIEITDEFKDYNDQEDAMIDHVNKWDQLVANSGVNTLRSAAESLVNGSIGKRYTTDPNYVSKLISIMQQMNADVDAIIT